MGRFAGVSDNMSNFSADSGNVALYFNINHVPSNFQTISISYQYSRLSVTRSPVIQIVKYIEPNSSPRDKIFTEKIVISLSETLYNHRHTANIDFTHILSKNSNTKYSCSIFLVCGNILFVHVTPLYKFVFNIIYFISNLFM